MPITTVLFDADGVLQHPPARWRDRILELTGSPDWQAVSLIEDPFMVGGDPTDAYEVGYPDRTVSVPQILEAWNDTVVDAVALDLVDAVRARGVRCYLASNQQTQRAAWMRTGPLGRHLDGLFFSCDLGLAKPAPAYFAAIVETLGVDPTQTLFIDDDRDNCAGAREAGLVVEWKTNARGASALEEILQRHGLLG